MPEPVIQPEVLHLNISDSGGGVGKASYRLHQSLRATGCNSWMLVDSKRTQDPHVICDDCLPSRFYKRLRSRIDKWPAKLCKHDHWEYFSFNFLPNPSVKLVWKKLRPKVIHLHWIGDGMLPIQYFPEFSHIPTVATLHGRWLFNGAQHLHSDKSKRFVDGFSSGNRDADDAGIDVDRWVWNRKRQYFEKNPFEIVTLSRWMEQDVKRSALLGNRAVHRIPNGLDLDVYHPLEKDKSRSHFGLPQEKVLFLFGANFATKDRNKGYHDFVNAIRFLENENDLEFEVVVFGSERPEEPLPFRSKTHFLGFLKAEEDLVRAYSACNCFVLPSHQDNLPNTVMESMACGTPCVAYDVGGVSDMVVHGETGLLAEARNVRCLAQRMNEMLVLSPEARERLVRGAVRKIHLEFDAKTQAARMIELYQSILNKHTHL